MDEIYLSGRVSRCVLLALGLLRKQANGGRLT